MMQINRAAVNQRHPAALWAVVTLLIGLALSLSGCAVPALTDPAEATTQAGQETAVDSTTVTTDTLDTAVTDATGTDQEMHNDIPVGFTEEGFPYRGSLDAPVVMYEFSDFQCPFCQRYYVQTEPTLNDSYVRNGTVRVVFRDFPLVQLHPNAPAAHAATLCVAEQGAPLYWEMHDQVFLSQQEWSQDPDAAAFFSALAEQAGADMALYADCIASGRQDAVVQARVDEAVSLGFSGTPSFRFVNAASSESFDLIGAQPYEQFAAYVEAVAAGETPAGAAAADDAGAGEAQIPVWATAEGLAADPARPGYNLAGDFYRGNLDASVVVVEFSDFQCPYCQRHHEQTQPVLDEQFVDTGKVLWIFKHFPLSIHPQAPQAGAAAECAAQQGKFWEMSDELFATASDWGVSDPIPPLIDLATKLNLDVDAFTTCINDPAALDAVNSDMNDGAPFVRGTPTFIVLYNGQGSIIPGALPTERFTEVLQQVLDELAGAGE